MNISRSFTVASPLSAVWAVLHDVPEVARCLPGAELTEDKGGGRYAGRVAVRLGPLSPTFEGDAEASFDEDAHTVHVEGSGVDRKGGSRGRVGVDVVLDDDAIGTRVQLEAVVALAGPAAQFGRSGLIEEVTRRLIGEFASCLEAKLAAETPEEASAVSAGEVRGFSLLFGSLGAWIRSAVRKLFGRGGA